LATIEIKNHGPLITATDYWQSEYADAGKLLISPNAGAIRCLMPPSQHDAIGELRQAKYAIVSVGAWSRGAATRFGLRMPLSDGAKVVEILWEDHSNSPHTWHLSEASCLAIPGDPSPNEWVIACWVERRGQPHKALERPARWRRVPRVPCMEPWKP
jgi:hypothetical protein